MSCRSTCLFAAVFSLALPAIEAAAFPETVHFSSADRRTEIVGYLFSPSGKGPHPAIVLLHGRGGLYSTKSNANCTRVARALASPCNAGTLSKRHTMWGAYWAKRGYLALLPDSFGPRGKARGFGRFTHGDPERENVNELTVRPLDAEGALSYLRRRNDVATNDIFLQGWSNGGSTALNVIHRQGTTTGFRAALALYPGCGEKALLGRTIATPVPITMFLAAEDEEVSPETCRKVAERSREGGSRVDVVFYPGASHGFDDPGRRRQSIAANHVARDDAMKKALAAIEALRSR